MKSFKQILSEELNYHQKFFVDSGIDGGQYSGESRLTDFSDHIFDPKNTKVPGHTQPGPAYPLSPTHDVRVIPYSPPIPKPSYDMKKHLDTLGYDVHDYEAGLAKRKGAKNPIKISKILASDNSKKLVSHEYVASEYDNHRAFKRNTSDLEVMITRDPYHVAEQSTNKPWRSCMALGTCPGSDDWEERPTDRELEKEFGAVHDPGIHYKKTIDDIHGGAHMAYLIRKGDYELKKPLARLSLKPYNSPDMGEIRAKDYEARRKNPYHLPKAKDLEPEHTILRPIGRVYGLEEGSHLSDHFENFMTDFTEKHFPMKRKHSYYILDYRVQRDHHINSVKYNPNALDQWQIRNLAIDKAQPKKMRRTMRGSSKAQNRWAELNSRDLYRKAARQARKKGVKFTSSEEVNTWRELANEFDLDSIEKAKKVVENYIIKLKSYLQETSINPVGSSGGNRPIKKKKPLVPPVKRVQPIDRYEPRREEKPVTYRRPKGN
jgi:hypothetical protein